VSEIDTSINILRQQYTLQQQSSAATHEQVEAFHKTVEGSQDLRNKIANFDDFFRPLRNYFYWEPHCFDIPACAALRSVFDAVDVLRIRASSSAATHPAYPNSLSHWPIGQSAHRFRESVKDERKRAQAGISKQCGSQ